MLRKDEGILAVYTLFWPDGVPPSESRALSPVDDDLGYSDDETCRLEPIEDPFGPRLSPMSPE
jgi:hypothetical protein